MNLPSILRHWFTAAATATTLYLASALLLPAGEAHRLSDALGMLVEPLMVVVSLLAVALWRMALTKGGQIFRRSAGEPSTGAAGGLGLWLVGLGLGMTAGLMGLCLPSCSPGQLAAARAVPAKVCVVTPKGTVCYSSADGVSAVITPTK